MCRLIELIVRSGLVIAWRFANCPTRRSPVLVKATTDGVVREPSELGITVGWGPSITATTELVVPRSIPTTLAINTLPQVMRPVSFGTSMPAGVRIEPTDQRTEVKYARVHTWIRVWAQPGALPLTNDYGLMLSARSYIPGALNVPPTKTGTRRERLRDGLGKAKGGAVSGTALCTYTQDSLRLLLLGLRVLV